MAYYSNMFRVSTTQECFMLQLGFLAFDSLGYFEMLGSIPAKKRNERGKAWWKILQSGLYKVP